jgi:site-specific recombinase XerD
MDKKCFIQYLESKDFSVATIDNYIKFVNNFFKKVQKEELQITKPDVLKYLEYLKNDKKYQNMPRSNNLTALKHYFSFLYNEGKIAENPCLFLKIRGTKKKQLYNIFTSEELETLFDNYYQLFVRNYDDSHIPKVSQKTTALCRERNVVILNILVHQGVATTEIKNIELEDIDLIKATIKIRSSRKHNERKLQLKATQIGLFINYLQNIRPQCLEYQKNDINKLFLPLPPTAEYNKTVGNEINLCVFSLLKKNITTFDRKFVNFIQVRASLISFWIKTYGLRKAQYFAGHRYISTTERFLSNNLEDLIDDISKLHPF